MSLANPVVNRVGTLRQIVRSKGLATAGRYEYTDKRAYGGTRVKIVTAGKPVNGEAEAAVVAEVKRVFGNEVNRVEFGDSWSGRRFGQYRSLRVFFAFGVRNQPTNLLK